MRPRQTGRFPRRAAHPGYGDAMSRAQAPMRGPRRAAARCATASTRGGRRDARARVHPGGRSLSVVVVIVWALSGPLFGFSDSWQLVINTSTTVITFWMVFVIQNSQGRDARAIHLKLDEIIRANAEARNEFIVAERATEAEVEQHERDLQRVVEEAPAAGAAAGSDAR